MQRVQCLGLDRDVGPQLPFRVFLLRLERSVSDLGCVLGLRYGVAGLQERPSDVDQAAEREQDLKSGKDGHGLLGRQVSAVQWVGFGLGLALAGASLPVAFRFRCPDRGALVGGSVLLGGMALCLGWLLG